MKIGEDRAPPSLRQTLYFSVEALLRFEMRAAQNTSGVDISHFHPCINWARGGENVIEWGIKLTRQQNICYDLLDTP